MNRILRPFLAAALVFFLSAKSFAQDIHFSQFGNSPLNLSPGLTGVFGCDMRFAASYRNQWKQVPVPYSTFAGSLENKFYHKKGKYDRFFTGALLLDYDRQGLLRLSSYIIGLNGSYTQPLNATNFLTLGLHGSWNGRHFDDSQVTVDNQWTGKYFDGTQGFGENIVNGSVGFADFAAGANYRWNNASKRHKLDFGVGLFHVFKPKNNFFDQEDTRLNRRFTAYALGSFGLTSRFDLAPQIAFQKQGTYKEILPEAMLRFYLNPNVYQPVSLGLGLGARAFIKDPYNSNKTFVDAWVPQAELLLGTWQFGLSYDINVSRFKEATNRRGGPEFSVVYRLCKVKPLPLFKICPII